jgi:exosortase
MGEEDKSSVQWRGNHMQDTLSEIHAEVTGAKINRSTAARLANESGPPERQQRFHTGWVAHWGWILLAILVFTPTIRWLWQRWTISVWHNVHGMFVPFIVAYFIREVLRADPIVDAEQSAWGFLFLIPGLAMVALDSAIRTQLLSAFGMIVCLPGLSLLLLGGRRTRALAFVWALSFLMLPIPAAFIERFDLLMRRITATGAELVLPLFDVPVGRVDTTLFLAKHNLIVGDACSGFAPLYASITLALILAYMNPSWLRRVITLGAVFPITMACNILRIVLLALILQRWGPAPLGTALHPASGLLMSTVGLALLVFLGRVEMRGVAR